MLVEILSATFSPKDTAIAINFMMIVFAITIVYASSAERVATHIGLLALQGVVLFGLALVELKHISWGNLLFILAETFIFKALIIPYYLRRIVIRNKLAKKVETAVPSYYILMLVSVAIIIFYLFAFSLSDKLQSKYFTVSISAIFTGVLLILTHKGIIGHLIGYLIIENGIFLLSLAIGSEMPMIVNTCILMDILISVLVLGVFVDRIGHKFSTMQIQELAELKD